MERRAAAILLMLALVALVVGAAVADDTLRLPSDAVLDLDRTRPWDCCDKPVCTKSGRCGCKDVVEKCFPACQNCKPVDGVDPARFMCRDASNGGPPPRCTEE